MRMAIMRAAMHPVIIERIPAPINEARSSPNAVHITEANVAIRNNVINNTRIVFRDVHIFFANRLNRNVIINGHCNFVITAQIAISVSNPTHSLHGIHHIGFLHIHGFAKLFCPSGILRHFTEHIRERNKRYHRFVEFQISSFNGTRQTIAR